MNDLAQEAGGVSPVLAVAIVLGACVPLWALALWMATSRVPWRWVADRDWRRGLVAAYGVAATLLAGLTGAWVHHDLLGPGRPTEQRIVGAILVVGALLYLATLAWADWRGRIPAAPSSGAAKAKPAPRTLLVVLLVWVALAGSFAMFKVGPLATTPASPRDLYALALACGIVATLIVLLIVAIREKRKDAMARGSAGTRGK